MSHSLTTQDLTGRNAHSPPKGVSGNRQKGFSMNTKFLKMKERSKERNELITDIEWCLTTLAGMIVCKIPHDIDRQYPLANMPGCYAMFSMKNSTRATIEIQRRMRVENEKPVVAQWIIISPAALNLAELRLLHSNLDDVIQATEDFTRFLGTNVVEARQFFEIKAFDMVNQ